MASDAERFSQLKAPNKLADLGVPEGLALDLFTRRVFFARLTTIGHVCAGLGISHAVGDELAESLKKRNLLQYHGVEGRDYTISLTDLGQRNVDQQLASGRHAAGMPINLAEYHALVISQRASPVMNRESIRAAYADLVVEDSVLDQIGPAFVSDGAIFFYGPPGTGKTSLAERTSRFFEDLVLIPHYIEVDGQLIGIFDPSIHQPAADQPPDLDPRLVLCERPLVMVGGELQPDMLDLGYDSVTGLNIAPIQLLANNGILVVDDFGRQKASPDELLNRWILPLSRGIDFLRPYSGNKFTVPFELKLLLSTNLEPSALGDDAFLRRLRNKVYVGPCTEIAFNWILIRAAARAKLEVTSEWAEHLARRTIDELGELRPYVAVDFCEMALSICTYDGSARALTPDLIDRVSAVYFVRGWNDGGRGAEWDEGYDEDYEPKFGHESSDDPHADSTGWQAPVPDDRAADLSTEPATPPMPTHPSPEHRTPETYDGHDRRGGDSQADRLDSNTTA